MRIMTHNQVPVLKVMMMMMIIISENLHTPLSHDAAIGQLGRWNIYTDALFVNRITLYVCMYVCVVKGSEIL